MTDPHLKSVKGKT